MNTSVTTQNKSVSYQNKLRLNRKYYQNKYETDPTFRQAEIDRNSARVLSKYHTDPEYRQRMINNAKARYRMLKAQNPK